MKIDVILLTKNSMKPTLPETVKSIYDNVPVNRLIVVDGGSTDGTLEYLSRFPRVEIIDDSKGNRATAREKGIKAVETEWHLHVDSDVVLCRDWFKYASKYMKKGVGAIWGVAIPVEEHVFNMVYSMSKLYRMRIIDTLIAQVFSKRYMTHDTLIRTEAVEDIRIPRDLYVWEDHYIGLHIVSKGYKFIKTRIPYCLHYVSEKSLESNILNGYILNKYRYLSPKDILLRVSMAVPKGVWIYINTRDYISARNQVISYIYMLKGWLLYRG